MKDELRTEGNNMLRNRKHAGMRWAIACTLLLLAGVASAQDDIPAAINYQGKLTNPSDGQPVASGVYQVEFRIWGHPTSTDPSYAIWGRSFPIHVVTNGLFNVLITDDGGELTGPVPQTNDIRQAFQEADRYLGLKVTQGPGGAIDAPEISPRQRLVSAPYAMHAQNATDAYHADEADEATLAQDSDKLGGTAAAAYFDEDRFDSLGLHTSYLTVLSWEDGGIPYKSSLVDYWGFYYLGDTPSAPGAGIKLVVDDGKIQAKDGILAEGPITPSVGDSEGIQFPSNPGGGSGDKASIEYYVQGGSGEDCALKLAITNDSDDDLILEASGDIEMHGNIRMMRSWTVEKTWNNGDSTGSWSLTAPTDGFLLVDVHSARVRVEIGGVVNVENRSIDDDDDNYGSHLYPVAKGELMTVTFEEDLPDDSTFVRVYWRHLGL
ncbi:MAG: hypothetical protein JXQ75_17850 [Phycisphaerae bacterium]|nr:hypothetical protein [Phycisphaerae bacterium]